MNHRGKPTSPEFTCQGCSRQFSGKQGLSLHIRKCTGKVATVTAIVESVAASPKTPKTPRTRPFACSGCSRNFTTDRGLKIHSKTCYSVKSGGHSLSQEIVDVSLNNSILLTPPNDIVVCRFCNEKIRAKDKPVHERRYCITLNRILEEEAVNKSTDHSEEKVEPSSASSDEAEPNFTACKHCGKNFLAGATHRWHENQWCKSKPKDTVIKLSRRRDAQTPPKRHRVSWKNIGIGSELLVRAKQPKTSSPIVRMTRQTSLEEPTDGPIKCSYCDRVFETRRGTHKHETVCRKAHIKDGVMCPTCEKVFDTRYECIDHKLFCKEQYFVDPSIQSAFPCTICGKLFDTVDRAKKHEARTCLPNKISEKNSSFEIVREEPDLTEIASTISSAGTDDDEPSYRVDDEPDTSGSIIFCGEAEDKRDPLDVSLVPAVHDSGTDQANSLEASSKDSDYYKCFYCNLKMDRASAAEHMSTLYARPDGSKRLACGAKLTIISQENDQLIAKPSTVSNFVNYNQIQLQNVVQIGHVDKFIIKS